MSVQRLFKVLIVTPTNSLIEDVASSPRDSTYFSLLSSLLLLSSLSTIYLDTHYAFSVSRTGVLQIYSLATATKICETTVHNSECCKIEVFTPNSERGVPTELNQNKDYFICSLSRQERIMTVHLFSDHNIPFKSIMKSIRNGKYKFKDYSGIALLKVAILFIPCNSSIQSDACTLCRHRQHHVRITSEFFIFQHSTDLLSPLSSSPALMSLVPASETLDDIDYTSLPFGDTRMVFKRSEETQPLLGESGLCQCCQNPTDNMKSRMQRFFGCCWQTMDHLIITPQSLMPTSFSQDTILKRHLPPDTLRICQNCTNAILCGSQTLAQSGYVGTSPMEENSYSFRNSRTRGDLNKNAGVSLSVLLAHVGHSVGDYETDKDFKIIILPWDELEGKKPTALRIYLQLSDMVTVWYDLLIKDIGVYYVCFISIQSQNPCNATNRKRFILS